jgi:DHA1 family bicyclomycin/chloramphenicol resistance-like MFS transporter
VTTTVHPGDSLSRNQRLVYIIVLGALTALGPFTIDLYLPAFPVMQSELDVTASVIQLTLTATTIGFALGQLVIGPWSDRVGRRLPLIIATAVHVVASFGVAFAPTIEVLTAFRIVQGIGTAGGSVVAIAMVRDLFGGQPLVRMLSRLALVSGLAPILAPVIGSQLLLWLDWRGIFFFLAAYGILALAAAAFFIVETFPAARRSNLERPTIGQRYKSLFRDRIFVGAAIMGGMTFSGLFSYLSSSSFIFQDVYGLDAQQYGILFAVNSLGVVAGVQTSSRLVRRIGPQWILAGSTILLLASALTIVLLDALDAGLIGILIVPLRAGDRARRARCGGRYRRVPSRCGELRARRSHLSARGPARSCHGRSDGCRDGRNGDRVDPHPVVARPAEDRPGSFPLVSPGSFPLESR